MAKVKKTFNASSDTPLVRHGWWGQFLEILPHDDDAVDLGRLANNALRVHLNHDWRMPVGVVTAARVIADEGRMELDVEFDDALEEGRMMIERIDSGLYNSVSIGWDYNEKDLIIRNTTPEVQRETGCDEEVIYGRWTLLEVSMVSVPADQTAGVAARSANSQVNNDRQNQRRERVFNIIKKRRAEAMEPNENNPNPTNPAPEPRSVTPPPPPAPEPAPEQRSVTPPPAPAADNPPAPEQRTVTQDAPGRAAYEVFRQFRGALRNAGISQTDIDVAMTAAEEANESRDQATARCIALMENNPAVEPTRQQGRQGRSPQVQGRQSQDRNEYNVGRALTQLIRGELRGSNSLEAELHDDAEAQREELGLPFAERSMTLPIRLLVQDRRVQNSLMSNPEISARLGGRRDLDSADNAGLLIDAFQESMLIEALYSQSGLLPLVDKFGEMLTRDVKLPIETGAHVPEWIDEDGDRDDTTTPQYANTMDLAWKEITATFEITRRLLDQSGIVYQQIMRTLHRDIPRGINNGLWNGTGANNQPTGVLNKTGIAVTALHANGRALTWGDINGMYTAVDAANAGSEGMGYFFAPAKVIGKLRETEITSSTTGEFIVDRMSPLDKPTIRGVAGVRDNDIPTNLTKGTSNGTLGAFIYGVPKSILLGYFSAMQIIVDPYTKKRNGKWDIQIRQALDFNFKRTATWNVCKDVNYS